MPGELVWFELGVEDGERGRKFYESLFDWRFEDGPSEGGFITRSANILGGIHGGDEGAAPYIFFKVDDMDTALRKVQALGGTVMEADVEASQEQVARFGRFRLCRDDQGSPFGLHEPPG